MVAEVLNSLCKSADSAATRVEREAISKAVTKALQAYDEAYERSVKVEQKPHDGLSKVVCSIRGIETFVDEHDNELFYELDGMRFDSCLEVVQHLVTDREQKMLKALNTMRKAYLKELEKQTGIEQERLKELLEDKERIRPSRLVTAKRRREL